MKKKTKNPLSLDNTSKPRTKQIKEKKRNSSPPNGGVNCSEGYKENTAIRHLNTIEKVLIEKSKILDNTKNPVIKGYAREIFIKEFLQDHLPETLSFGTGHIIDCDSSDEMLNQIDIIIYQKHYPKFYFGGGVGAFLAESVVATIEVKSTINSKEFKTSVDAARKIKSLKISKDLRKHSAYAPPNIISYIVAYEGPKKLETVDSWLKNNGIMPFENLDDRQLQICRHQGEKYGVASDSIDGVFILGKGFRYYDNIPLDDKETRPVHNIPRTEDLWIKGSEKNGNLAKLFFLLTYVGVSDSNNEYDLKIGNYFKQALSIK